MAPRVNRSSAWKFGGKDLEWMLPPWRQPRGKVQVNLPQMLPDSGGICMGGDQRNHQLAPGLPAGWSGDSLRLLVLSQGVRDHQPSPVDQFAILRCRICLVSKPRRACHNLTSP